jgi:hypothetical protein
MTLVDRAALERAIAETVGESPGRAGQIAIKLKHESWRSVAEFAAYHCQCRALQVRPWDGACPRSRG